MADLTPRVIAGVKHSQSRVDDLSAQLELLRLSQEFLQVFKILCIREAIFMRLMNSAL